ncbi:type I methionyl aminopeptidase [Planctomicrobium sp. SH664]|uniref:type I methionyl aminopeptidase n=1 Tax=Planctomicrobium sp. SH664 TaxID=3448125 RepID=UPI003F5B38A1
MAMITLKSRREIEQMRAAGQVVAEAHQIAARMVAPGVTTREIDQEIEKLFDARQAQSLFKGFPGKVPFPAVTCISVNEQIVHGIPGDYVLKVGDIVSIDTGCRVNGWCGDSAWTYAVGEIDSESRRLMDVGQEILRTAIIGLGQESRWSAVARKMMKVAVDAGFSLVEDFVGHGIGREMHEPPQVPNLYIKKMERDDFPIQPGLVLAVEPMLNAGTARVRILKDHWTAVTADGKRSVHFEHTIAVTAEGPILLTEGVGTPLLP